MLGIAFVAAGPLTNAVGARWTYAAAAGAVVLGAAAGLRYTRGIELELGPATVKA